jgi:FixJ family two-component response regulator
MDDFIAKPVRLQDLIQVLEKRSSSRGTSSSNVPSLPVPSAQPPDFVAL